MKLVAQLQTEVPNPLADDLPDLLTWCHMADPAVGVLFLVFISSRIDLRHRDADTAPPRPWRETRSGEASSGTVRKPLPHGSRQCDSLQFRQDGLPRRADSACPPAPAADQGSRRARAPPRSPGGSNADREAVADEPGPRRASASDSLC